MNRTVFDAAGLTSLLSGSPVSAKVLVVLLHGYAMQPEDLEPFSHSIKANALFCFPKAPLVAPNGGFAWWPIDEAKRAAQLERGARDLAEERPETLALRREQLGSFLRELRKISPSIPLVVGGFSQGGMLASDFVLHSPGWASGLVLMSSSRISVAEWSSHQRTVQDLPMLISHGRSDKDLAFSTGEALRDFHAAGGARITWVPFEGGHEIPLIVWRSLRTFLRTLCA